MDHARSSLSYETIKKALAGERLPAAFVDLDALERNIGRHVALVAPRGTPLRVASKSVRSAAVLRRILDRGGAAFQGLMCFSAEEAEFLAGEGFDDLLIAYPIIQTHDTRRVARMTAAGKTVHVVCDSRASVDAVSLAGASQGVRVSVILCLDMSLQALGGSVFLGVRRSPLRDAEDVVAMARYADSRPGTKLGGVMGYEAQIAGLGDDVPFERLKSSVKSAIKRASVRDVKKRRSAVVQALRDAGFPLSLVNGGGTGSLDTTLPESGVTEVTAGSGFFKPHLFDHYRAPHMRALEPAAFFAVEVTRRPARDMVTCLGGGYVASGQAGADKVPLPFLPEGLSLLPMEMCGEVQTPLRVPSSAHVSLGDPIVFRHAKAGELCERFRELLLIRGGKVVDRALTYRGQGQCFF